MAGSTDGSEGFQDGSAGEARFNNPSGVAVNTRSGTIVVVDTHNNKIRQIFSDGQYQQPHPLPSTMPKTWPQVHFYV